MNTSTTDGQAPSSDPMTTTQKIWLPISKLDAAHQRTVSKMVQAYTRGDLPAGTQAQKIMKLIEKKLSKAYQRAHQHIIEKVRS